MARQLGEIDGVIQPVARDDPEQESEVADAVDDEGLLRGVRRGLALVPMSDEQVGAESDELQKRKS